MLFGGWHDVWICCVDDDLEMSCMPEMSLFFLSRFRECKEE